MNDAPAWQAAMRDLVESRIGVRLRADEPLSALQAFVQARIQALRLASAESYVNYLRAEPQNGVEFVRLAGVCTNGQTSFFRDMEQWGAISCAASHIYGQERRPLAIWSAGCSTGEEPYTCAMVLQEAGVPGHVTATDVNAELLATAAMGIYGSWTLRHVPQLLGERYFETQEEHHAVRSVVRDRVTFRRHNLMLDDVPRPVNDTSVWDIILCRNVFIYYSATTVQQIVGRMMLMMAPHAWLFLAAAESLGEMQLPLIPEPIGARVGYRRSQERSITTSAPAVEKVDATAITYAQSLQLLQNNAPEARQSLSAFLSVEPGHVLAWLALGHYDLAVHNFGGALDAYQHAQGADPLLAETHYFQGLVHRKVGALSQAEQALERSLFLDPTFWPAAYLLAGIYDRQGRPSLSRRELMRTVHEMQLGLDKPLFRSHTAHNPSLRLDPQEVLQACLTRLGAGNPERLDGDEKQ